jgi:DUF4097 and DUF4098 domain-containing protein YvlB
MNHPYRILLAAVAVAGTAAAASAKIDRTVERTFKVQPGVHLHITTAGGNIQVVDGSGDTVRVVATEHIRASSDAEADALAAKYDLSIEQNGPEIVASAGESKGFVLHFGPEPVVVDFRVETPRAASAEIRTSGGNIRLGSIGGDVDAETSGGNIALGEGRKSVRLSTSGGNISAGRIAGRSDIHTSGGDITLDSLAGETRASTSGGDVRAVIDGPLSGDCSLSTSGGRVKAAVSRGATFRLDASTSGGEVRISDVPVALDHGRIGSESVAGTVNGGGPTLRLRSSGGDIDIVAR